eukprot:TRINITY_DN54275_c0_g1_i1.p1 TRINITY_DN54275_c0_g1~~TRINITY_DN54275_c0_g1_i1.p1  ORF type:complete len:336 (+),score=26.48 TRINITY_DN54275_c0_g1_i1:141-1010(+)
MPWQLWKIPHPDGEVHLEFQRLSEDNSPSGLTGAMMRLESGKEIPLHVLSIGVFLNFLQGDGQVKVGAREVNISHRLTVNQPAHVPLRLRAGEHGLEFVMYFAAPSWDSFEYIWTNESTVHGAVCEDGASKGSLCTTQPVTPSVFEWDQVSWVRGHPGEVSFKELTGPEDWFPEADGQSATGSSPTGLTGGFLRVPPGVQLFLHYHNIGEVYQLLRGDGLVFLGHNGNGSSYYEELEIRPGLTVHIPDHTYHGQRAGETEIEFIWMFAAPRWTDIQYVFYDPTIKNIWR